MIDDIGSNSKDEIQFDHRVEYKNCLRGNETIEQLITKIDLMSFLQKRSFHSFAEIVD